MGYRIGERVKRDRRGIKKYIIGVIALGFPITIALSGGAAMAHDGNQDNNGQCSGTLVINVTQKVRNDADSGLGGYWANDNYNRSIKVWQTTTGTSTDEAYTFCAVVKYDGQFTTYAGPSPQNTGTVGAGVTGDFSGGYTSTIFTGTLLAPLLKPTHGNIGTIDYNCDSNGNCPGSIDWTTFYFSSTSGFDFATWGWQYNTCNNGSWVNALAGNSGDITGNVSHKDKCHEDNDHNDNDGHHDKDKHHHDEGNRHDGHHEHGDNGPEE